MIHVKRWINLNTARLIYTSTSVKPFCSPLVALTEYISHLSRIGEVESARKVFDEMRERDSVSWNVMIRCYVENEMIEDARELFDEMPMRTSVSWNTMIMAHINEGRIWIALKLFVVMPDKDVVSWTAMVTGLCRAAMVDSAWLLFKQMPNPNVVSWSAMVSGFQQHGHSTESLSLFKEMLSARVQPNSHLFTSVLSACADLAVVSMSEQVYCQIHKRGFHGNTHVGNSAVSMFFKTGNFHNARRVFLDMDEPDRVTWNSMIVGFAQHGYGIEAMMIFHHMQKARFLPDDISYMGVLQGCSHCGFLEEGRKYFRAMKTDHGLSPEAPHFWAMVDLYARAGKLKEAYEVILNLPFEPTAIFWRTLLSGCRIWGDVKLGVLVAEKVLELEPYNSSACLMVINIYALTGKWDEVAKMRRHMRDAESKKELGCSWIDIQGRHHLFTTGDEIHFESDQIFSIIDLLAYDIGRYHLKLEGSLVGMEQSCVM